MGTEQLFYRKCNNCRTPSVAWPQLTSHKMGDKAKNTQWSKWSFKHCKATFPSSVYSRLQVTLSFDFSSQKRKSFISSQLLPRVTVHSHLLQPAIKSTLSLPEIQNGYKKLQGYFPGKWVILPMVFYSELLTSRLNTSTAYELQFKYTILPAPFQVHN